ncbi:MAG: hypothetical protein VCA17_09360, partial [Dehalococcoidia bacterium]
WEGMENSYFNYNDFISNTTDYLFKSKLVLASDVNAKYNWWGTVKEEEIKSQIYDFFQSSEYTLVDYSDWETNPIAAQAGKVGITDSEVGPK